MTYSLTLAEQTYVESYVKKTALMPFELQRFFKANGLIKALPEWMDNYEAHWLLESNPGMMGLKDYENAKELGFDTDGNRVTLLTNAGLIVMTPSQLAESRRSALGVQRTFQEILSQQTLDFNKQVEGIFANGDTHRYPRPGDPMSQVSGATVYPGLLNGADGVGLTLMGAGIDEDDDMTTYGDYLATCVNAEQIMADAGIDTSRLLCLMNSRVAAQFKISRHPTSGLSEFNEVKQMFPTWQFARENHVLENGALDEDHMWFVSPFDLNGEAIAFLLQSKEVHVIPKYAGGIGANNAFEWLIGWKGGAMVKDARAVVKTGALTLEAP